MAKILWYLKYSRTVIKISFESNQVSITTDILHLLQVMDQEKITVLVEISRKFIKSVSYLSEV